MHDPQSAIDACAIPLRVLSLLLVVTLFPKVIHADEPATQPSELKPSAESVAADARFHGALRRRVSLDVKDMPIAQVLASISRQARVPLATSEEALTAVGAQAGSAISIRLHEVAASLAIELVLRSASDYRDKKVPTVYADGEGVHFKLGFSDIASPVGDHPEKTIEISYDVADLIRCGRVDGRSNADAFYSIEQLIQQNIASDTWLENGGTISRFRIGMAHPPATAQANASDDPADLPTGGGDVHDPLIITTTPEFQNQVADLLTSLRDGLSGAPPRWPAGFKRTMAAFRKPIPATFRLMRLGAVFDAIARSANVNLFVDWRMLKITNVTPDFLVSIPVPKNGMMPTGAALSAVIEAVGNDISLEVDDEGIVEIFAASQNVVRQPILCCYNVRDLLLSRAHSTPWPVNTSYDDRFEAMTKLIEEQVASDTWRVNGGEMGTVKDFGWILLINQTPFNQARVTEVLQNLR